jgi:uncharacterized protein (TIGR03435 family)
MKLIVYTLTIAAAISANTSGQTPDAAALEFEVASIKAAAPSPSAYFHSAGSITGGPGSSDPGMFHCTCSVANLITKAFELQRYQFPGEASLPGGIFEISAKVPAGTTPEQFLLMLQNLLKERFGLAWHFDKKKMQGYELIVAKNGPKLRESTESVSPPTSGNRGEHGHEFGHSGMMVFGGQARYRGDRQTMEELARALSNQIAKPVDDRTGLQGKYDISLTWSADVTHNHPEGVGGHAGGGGHGDQGSPASASSSLASGDPSGPTLFDALQSQLGLKLVTAKKAVARIFIVDRVEKTPTAN